MKYIINEALKCKLCGSERIIRFGAYHGIQRWWCKDCCHKFADNNAVSNMKTPAGQVSTAIELFFAGIPVNKIPALIFQQYGSYITRTAVFQWVSHFGGCAISQTRESKVSVGDIWILGDNNVINGQDEEGLRIIDIIDLKTRFLLATEIVNNRGMNDLQSLVRASVNVAGKLPFNLFIDESAARQYSNGFTDNSVSRIPEIIPLEHGLNSFLENWNRRVNSRNKVIRGLRKRERLKLILDGWAINYNYFCAQDELSGNTPAGAAKAEYSLHNWSEVVSQPKLI
jgi:transposase-like protein